MNIVLPEPPAVSKRVCFISNSFVKRIKDLDVIDKCLVCEIPSSSYVLKMHDIMSEKYRRFQIRETYNTPQSNSYVSTTAMGDVYADGTVFYNNNSSFFSSIGAAEDFIKVIKYAQQMLSLMVEGN